MTTTEEKRYTAYFIAWDDTEEEYLYDRPILNDDRTEHDGWDSIADLIAWVTVAKSETGSIDDILLDDAWAAEETRIFNGEFGSTADWLLLQETRFAR